MTGRSDRLSPPFRSSLLVRSNNPSPLYYFPYGIAPAFPTLGLSLSITFIVVFRSGWRSQWYLTVPNSSPGVVEIGDTAVRWLNDCRVRRPRSSHHPYPTRPHFD